MIPERKEPIVADPDRYDPGRGGRPHRYATESEGNRVRQRAYRQR
jgi:hypothetical protein